MSEELKADELDWQHLGSRYEDAGLMLFEKRIDKLRNPRNDKVFERLVLESVDWVNVVALDSDGQSDDPAVSLWGWLHHIGNPWRHGRPGRRFEDCGSP